MISWSKRPAEVAFLLNPAFCGEILLCCIGNYQNVCRQPMPFLLAYLILPIVLHKKTRDIMPNSISTKMHIWIQDNQECKIGFAERVKNLIPITKETIGFLMQLNLLALDDQGGLHLNQGTLPNFPHEDKEILDCIKKARIVGHWFSISGPVSSIYTMWGVRP